MYDEEYIKKLYLQEGVLIDRPFKEKEESTTELIELETATQEETTVTKEQAIRKTTTIKHHPSNEERVCTLVDEVCADMEFENTALIKSMIYCESTFNKYCVSSYGSSGLMQITPRYFQELMSKYNVTDLCEDEEGNIRIGVHWIRHLINKYNGDVSKALVAYNCGEYEVDVKGITNNYYSNKVIRIAGEYS